MTSHGLYLNLESLWDAYATSVDHFIATLKADGARRKIALARWRKLQCAVQMVNVPTSLPTPLPTPVGYVASATASASVSTGGSTLKRS